MLTQVYMENMRTLPPEQAQAYMRPHPGMLSQRLTTPIAITYIDTEKISFERCVGINNILQSSHMNLYIAWIVSVRVNTMV